MTVAEGSVVLSSNLIVGTSLISTGQVLVAGGSVMLTGGAGPAYLEVDSGTFTLNQGSVTVDNLLLTNSTGQFAFNGGTLQAGSATVANGAPFVVGDGTTPAILQLQGGTYTFADGLVVANNATVTGCGTIVGNVVNNGTISTNCGPAGVIITAAFKTNSAVTVWFTTFNGSNHVLQYRHPQSDTGWTSILPGVTGNGGVTNQVDTNATAEARYYRIRVQ
jgi:hypothetical protein